MSWRKQTSLSTRITPPSLGCFRAISLFASSTGCSAGGGQMDDPAPSPRRRSSTGAGILPTTKNSSADVFAHRPRNARGAASAAESVVRRTASRRGRCGFSRRPMPGQRGARARRGRPQDPRSGLPWPRRGSPARPPPAPGERLVPSTCEARVGGDRPPVEGGNQERGRHGDADAIGDVPHRRLGVTHERLVDDDEDALGPPLVRLERGLAERRQSPSAPSTSS